MNETSEKLLSSFLTFTRFFFEARTGREFIITSPNSREPHAITISRALMQMFRGEICDLEINIPPRHAKTELMIHFVAWAFAHYPDCNFIYTSYAHSLAAKQTDTIRNIINLVEYQRLFPNVRLSDSTAAKDNFETTAGGSVYAVGVGGSITGRGAGIKGVYDRFGGCIIIDDPIKPADALSDVIRGSTNDWYFNTLISRCNNGNRTPIAFIGQCTHEDDLSMHLRNSKDGRERKVIVLPAIDSDGNALDPEMESMYHNLEKSSPYEFSAQYQQNPTPAGGGIFKRDWFRQLPVEPEIIATFLVCDTAETDKTYNDATVFHFVGLYKTAITQVLALHSIDCLETRVEPKDLRGTFFSFYQKCMQHKVKPHYTYIEKKSTGVTLVSVLKEMQGLTIIPIERNSSSGNKAARFLAAQPYISSGLFTFTQGSEHAIACIEHMTRITANDSHMHDDIADTVCDAIRIALIDKSLPSIGQAENEQKISAFAQEVAAINSRF